MTYALERSALTTFFTAQWADAAPVILDGHSGTPTDNSLRMTIQSGAAIQGSIGRMSNRINNVGMITFQIYTTGGKGSGLWRGHTDTLSDIFFEKAIDSAGALITAATQTFIRFSPPELGDNRHPYVGATTTTAPFTQTNFNVPFIRYTYR